MTAVWGVTAFSIRQVPDVGFGVTAFRQQSDFNAAGFQICATLGGLQTPMALF
jgi:hypothetical protein